MKKNSVPHSIWTHPTQFLAAGFGLGAMPWMPGTWGTLPGVLLYCMVVRLPLLWYLTIVVLAFVIGIYLCDVANRHFGREDHSGCVWDEIVAFPVVMIAVPFSWWAIVLGFVLFRIFDIWKPFPISWVQKEVKGGFGVMVDDLLAAIAAGLCLHLILWIVSL